LLLGLFIRAAALRGDAVLATASSIETAALEKQEKFLVRDLAERQLLRDLVFLDYVLQTHAENIPELRSLRSLPRALLSWIEERFSLVPVARVGDTLEVPASRLQNYLCDFDIPTDSSELVETIISEQGWKHKNEILIPVRLRLRQSD
jgi:hypothetical protein